VRATAGAEIALKAAAQSTPRPKGFRIEDIAESYRRKAIGRLARTLRKPPMPQS
jgi:hypothetical protein